MPDPPRFELVDGLLYVLGVEADDTLEKQFVNEKEQEDAVLEQLKDLHNFDDIKNAFDKGIASDQVEFFMEEITIILFELLNFFHLAARIENL